MANLEVTGSMTVHDVADFEKGCKGSWVKYLARFRVKKSGVPLLGGGDLAPPRILQHRDYYYRCVEFVESRLLLRMSTKSTSIIW